MNLPKKSAENSAELELLNRISPRIGGNTFAIPYPIRTIEARTRRRCAFRNQRKLYRRNCDLNGRPHVTIYRPGTEFPVFSIESFWSDEWDPTKFGLDYDPNRSFLAQLRELHCKVPRLGMMNRQSENSEYCNYSFANKNCYLVFSSHYEEDCYHGNCSSRNKCCIDYHWCGNCELCYECMFCSNCYQSVYLNHCDGCRECFFCVDCHGCKNCFLSANLRHQEFCIFNQQFSKEDYFSQIQRWKLDSHSGLTAAKKEFFGEFRKRFSYRAAHLVNCENCEGTDHSNCRNLKACFQADCSEDSFYSTYLGQTYDCMDVNYMGFDRCELSYQCIGCTSLFHGITCDSCWHCSDLIFCSYCFSSENCLGCLSLKRKSHCILNKQYTPAEYEKLAAIAIESLQKEGIWGDFFPASISAFGYNETVANEWYPLSRDLAVEEGFNWVDPESPGSNVQTSEVPDSILNMDPQGRSVTLLCEESKLPFKVTAGEISLLKRIGVPIPRRSPDIRQRDRLSWHSPWNIWKRKCAKTGIEIESTVSPERPEKVYSVEAYLQEFS